MVRAQAQEDWQREFDSIYTYKKERFPMDSTCFFDDLVEVRSYCHERLGMVGFLDEDSVFWPSLIDSIRFCAQSEHLYSLDLRSIWPNWGEMEKDSVLRKEFYQKMQDGSFADSSTWMSYFPGDTTTTTIEFNRALPYTYQRYLETIAELKKKAQEQGLEINIGLFTYPHSPWFNEEWFFNVSPDINPQFLAANRYILLTCDIGNPRVYYHVLLIN